MSELKAFDIVVAEEGYCEGIVKYRRAVYDKSEADKVISEKDKIIAFSKALVLEDIKLIRHHKYKRCLAMADYCLNREKFISSIAPLTETKKQVWEYCTGYWRRWERKWFKLAKQYKETK